MAEAGAAPGARSGPWRAVTSESLRFGSFQLDPGERQLRQDGKPVEINGRYLDALTLMVREPGKLISKDRFLDEVWRGVPVTDEALTQCIKTLRKQLGDDAAQPRFIETIPKHGYRFIAAVDGGTATPSQEQANERSQEVAILGAGGTIGGGLAGLIGGLVYGFAGASQPLQPGVGAVSVLLVLVCVTVLMALLGGAGVGFGIAIAGKGRAGYWQVIGGALGGLAIGAVTKLLGLDAFNLLLGRSPGDITGAAEGLLLGAAVGVGAWLAGPATGLRRSAAIAGAIGGAAGVSIVLLGGRLMGGSLQLLSEQFPNSRLRLDQLGALFGEDGFGQISQVVTGGLEGALFAACVVGAMKLARRVLDRS
ncbi:transcriptional regulator [Sphingomonas sp. NSE70-1]|uniref:Transcriptional regulator n=1 Tax=Sphingomonas caseinilyticus TaxID=2908205 RepID=A0ABT0RW26_9SPHN|nr:transcriptional regulator [Sphingomonas caseinilyticus]MCL6699205.1 transcriptional regulator [Sphingomonas caseinilyticus]